MDNIESLIKNFFGDGQEDLVGYFDSLMEMEDEQFTLVAPLLIQSLRQKLNTTEDRIELVALLQASGARREELDVALQDAYEAIEKIELSAPKKSFLVELLASLRTAISETEGIAKRYISLPVERCHPDAKLPVYAHVEDSGMDLFATEEFTINPGETVLVPTGLKVSLPPGYEIQIRPKSGKSLKTKLRVANTPGTIDSSYRGEIKVIVENVEPLIKELIVDEKTGTITSILYGKSYRIEKGEKFCQAVISEVPKANVIEVESIIKETDRGDGGFGSTGKR